MTLDPSTLKYDDRGLIPVVVQDVGTGAVLMLAFANREAVELTLVDRPGALLEPLPAGAVAQGRDLRQHPGGAGGDGGLRRATPCWCGCCPPAPPATAAPAPASSPTPPGWSSAGWRRCWSRGAGPIPETSYTARLLASGIERIAQKVGEEGVETAIAAVSAAARGEGEGGERRKALIGEAADLLYHLLVLLQASGVEPSEVGEELARRHGFGPSGHL